MWKKEALLCGSSTHSPKVSGTWEDKSSAVKVSGSMGALSSNLLCGSFLNVHVLCPDLVLCTVPVHHAKSSSVWNKPTWILETQFLKSLLFLSIQTFDNTIPNIKFSLCMLAPPPLLWGVLLSFQSVSMLLGSVITWLSHKNYPPYVLSEGAMQEFAFQSFCI